MKRLIKTLALAMLIFTLTAGVVEASSNLDRIYGKDRIETAIEISRRAYTGKTDTVVLAGYTGEVDSLSGTILAHHKKAPMLITTKGRLHDSVKARIKELGAKDIYLLGGPQVISVEVKEELEELGYNVTRIGGKDRESTAIDVAKEVKGEKVDEVFLAMGYNDYADALAINPETGKQGKPVFLTRTDKVSPSTKEGLKNLGVKRVTIIGGEAVVSGKVANEVKGMGITVDRIQGDNRFDTALNIAKEYASDSSGFLIANGYNYADALIGGYFSINENKPILLVKDDRISKNNIDYLKEKRSQTFILGGETVVSKEVYSDVEIALKDPINIKSLSVDGSGENKTEHKIKVEADADGKVLYKFSIKPDGGKWDTLRDYSEASFVEWLPSKQGNYEYKVEAKYLNSNYASAEKASSIKIVPLKPAKITSVELLGNKYKNTKHTIVAEATSTNDVLYKFYVKDEAAGKWTVIQDYSRNNTADWTPKKHGAYRYTVRVKDIMSEEDKDDLKGYDININPPIYYHTTRYEDTLDQALDKQVKQNTNASGRWATKAQTEKYLNPKHFLQFEPEGPKMAVMSGPLNVRKGPAGNYTKLGNVKKGDVYEILSQVNNYSQINYNGKKGWVSSPYIDVVTNDSEKNHLISIEINTNNLNIREEAKASSNKIATVSKGEVYIVLEEKKGWQKINVGSKTGWVSSSYTDYVNDVPREMYQFMILSGQTGLTSSQMNKAISGMGILDGKGASFIEASRKYNINELYLMAHAVHETGKGESNLSQGIKVEQVDGKKVEPKIAYNMYGIRAKDNDAERLGSEYAYKQGWFTPEKAIVEGAQWIGNNYINDPLYKQDTLYKMKYNTGGNPIWHQYATDIGWAEKQIKQIDRVMELVRNIDDVVLRFDIPKYK